MSESHTPAAPVPVEEDDSGRNIVMTPMPPGAWQLLLGLIVGALAPLFGFLGGSMAGAGPTDAKYNPMFLFLFGGIVLGGCGLVVAALGGLRLYRHLKASVPDA